MTQFMRGFLIRIRRRTAALRAGVAVGLSWLCMAGFASCTESTTDPPADATNAVAAVARSIEEQPLSVDLIVAAAAVVPGQTFYVGLRIQPEDGFHTYWKHPGVVGVPTGIEWHLPEGWQAGGIEWPAPEVVMMGPYPAHGYKGDVLLPTAIRVPAGAEAGEVTLRGDARWMCCADTCHPGFRTLEVSVVVVPAGADGAGRVDERVERLLAEALAARPQQARGFEFSAERDATGVTVIIQRSGEAGVDATPLADLAGLRFYCDQGIIGSDEEQQVQAHEDGSVRLRLVASPFGPEDATQLTGVFESASGWYLDDQGQTVHHIQVEMPLPLAPTL